MNKKDKPFDPNEDSEVTGVPKVTEVPELPYPVPPPRVFSDTENIKCFVLMPFGKRGEYSKGNLESDYVYNYIIRPGVRKFAEIMRFSEDEVEIIREVDRTVSGSITKNILKNIATADICIVDITGRNPNVFFELGIRYSLRHKITILLKQDPTEIPFDISGFKCITYDCFDPDPAISSIADFLVSGTQDYGMVDSLVFETFPNIQVYLPGVMRSGRELPNPENMLPWEEWWDRVLEIATMLKDPFDNGRFVPDAILGISNGGLMVADLLGREVFKGVPILSLWADRWLRDKSSVDTSCYYFDNAVNKATLAVLGSQYTDKKDSITILLLDDLVFTSNTVVQAETFIKKELDKNVEILFTPLYCRSTDYLDTVSGILPFGFRDGKLFEIRKSEYYKSLTTSRGSLPYRKVLGRE